MPRFFVDPSGFDGTFAVFAEDTANHVKNVLRRREGDSLELCDGTGTDYTVVIEQIKAGSITCRILGKKPSETELPAKITLFQGLPKKDKMEWIIQKAVELGAWEIIPVEMERSVVKLEDAKKEEKKRERWQTIARSAAEQSGRGIIPQVGRLLSFQKALEKAAGIGYNILPYEQEDGISRSRDIIQAAAGSKSIGVFIGPEGGFAPDEITAAKALGARTMTLGKRILRTETAGLTTLSLLMFALESVKE